MLRFYTTEGGVLKTVDQTGMQDALWIDAVAPKPEEVDLLHSRFELDLQDVADCLDPNESARVEIEETYDMLVLRTLLPDEHRPNRVQMIPIGIFVTREKIVTVRLGATFGAQELTADLKHKPRLVNKEDLFLALIRKVTRDLDRWVRPMERRLGAIQDEVLSARRGAVAHHAFELSNSLILLNTALLSNLNAISMLAKLRQLRLTKDQMDALDDLENDVSQLYEMTTIYREIMSNILTAYESAIANNLGDVMKTLTTISLILILPTLIASLYGMNVDLPFQGDPAAFWIVVGVSAVAVAALWILFRIKRIL